MTHHSTINQIIGVVFIGALCPLFTSWPPAEPPEDERMADLFAWAAD